MKKNDVSKFSDMYVDEDGRLYTEKEWKNRKSKSSKQDTKNTKTTFTSDSTSSRQKKIRNNNDVLVVISLIFMVVLYHLYQNKDIYKRINLEKTQYQYSATTNETLENIAEEIKDTCITDIDEVCIVKEVLKYITNIEYKINPSTAKKPLETIKKGYGDCDDKSNLLISLLEELNFDSYFVIVPNHIFVITHIEDDLYDELNDKKAFLIDNKKYYLLESTAKKVQIGFPLHYSIQSIEKIFNPFTRKTISPKNIKYE